MKRKKIIRNLRILVLIWLLLFLILSSCSKESSSQKQKGTKGGNQWHESPVLHELVKKGELPPLEERISSSPLQETVLESIGNYGGIMRKVWRGAGKDKWGVTKMMEEYLCRYENGKIIPNVAKKVETLDNSTRFIFHLREGMKWSDGVPFTANDVIFYWEEVLKKEVTGKKAHVSVFDATVKLIDDYTFEISFPSPRHLFLFDFINAREFFTPAHYAKTILPDFIGADKAAAMAKELGYSDTQAMLRQKLYYFWLDPDAPKLTAWLPVNDMNENIYILKRNPYFWKVDEEGNQLPYIDEIHYYRVEDTSAYTLKAIAGELDFQYRSIQVEDYTLFKENESRGDYNVYQWRSANTRCIIFNPTIEDSFLSKLYQNPKFRQAVSSAINREEIQEITEYRAFVKQASFVSDNPYHSKSWDNAFVRYDVAKANSLLDKIGLKWDTDKKYRLRPDGSKLEIVFTHQLTTQAELAMVELIAKYLTEIGLKILVKQVDRTYLEQLRDTNQVSMTSHTYQELGMIIDNKAYIPTRDEEFQWGLFGQYVETGGKEGIKPTGDYALLVEYWNELNSTPAGPKQDKWAKKIVDLHEKNLWIIGIFSQRPILAIAKKNMKNVPDGILDADTIRTPGNAKPWQFYYSDI